MQSGDGLSGFQSFSRNRVQVRVIGGGVSGGLEHGIKRTTGGGSDNHDMGSSDEMMLADDESIGRVSLEVKMTFVLIGFGGNSGYSWDS
jgi:hypothetical protein